MKINQALKLPLVIHGGTGLSGDLYESLIDNGVTKIIYYTALADAAGKRLEGNVDSGTHCSDT